MLLRQRRNRNLFFTLIWLNLTIKQPKTFDLFKYLSYRSKAASGVLGAPIESILSETINIHPFCGNEEKETLLSPWFDEMCRKFKKYLDESLRHSPLIGCEETWGKFKKYFDEILRHSLFFGCEETCGKFKKTLMEFWDTRFSLAARKRAEKLKKYLDEILRHSLFIGCEETSRKFKKYLDEISRHSVLIGCEESCGKLKNTLMQFWDTHFWLAAKKCAEK